MSFAASSSLAGLIAAPVRPGRVEWIGVRPARGVAVQELAAAELVAGARAAWPIEKGAIWWLAGEPPARIKAVMSPDLL